MELKSGTLVKERRPLHPSGVKMRTRVTIPESLFMTGIQILTNILIAEKPSLLRDSLGRLEWYLLFQNQ